MLLVVGRIGRAHGVLGEATIEIRTDLPDERFVVGARLQTDPATNGPLTIESARDHNGIMLLKFLEIIPLITQFPVLKTITAILFRLPDVGVFRERHHATLGLKKEMGGWI